jgi:hypothetical protein
MELEFDLEVKREGVVLAERGDGRRTVLPSRYSARRWVAGLVSRLKPSPQASPAPASEALDYTRRVNAETLDWYKNADLKSQILLTIDGVFLAFLTASVFKAPRDLQPIVARFGLETWFLLGLMTLALSGSIVSALLSLRSRGMLRRPDGRNDEAGTPEVEPVAAKMWFFEDIRRNDQKEFIRALHRVDQALEIDAVGHSAFILASNVSRKHRWVNVGFLLAGATLLLFLAAAVSYVIRSAA